VGFEPTLRNAEAAFRERYHEPLGHLSMKLNCVFSTLQFVCLLPVCYPNRKDTLILYFRRQYFVKAVSSSLLHTGGNVGVGSKGYA
jgi:hypothetical protein